MAFKSEKLRDREGGFKIEKKGEWLLRSRDREGAS